MSDDLMSENEITISEVTIRNRVFLVYYTFHASDPHTEGDPSKPRVVMFFAPKGHPDFDLTDEESEDAHQQLLNKHLEKL